MTWTSANKEVTGTNVNPAANIPADVLPAGAPKDGQADLSHYNHFTYEDRKGLSWVYRGPHDPTADRL